MSQTITIGRVNKSDPTRLNICIQPDSPVLGNPFFMKDESMRNEVCDKYQAHFEREILKIGSPFHTEVTRLYKLAKSGKQLNLQCWCAPKRCHGDTIKAFIDKFL